MADNNNTLNPISASPFDMEAWVNVDPMKHAFKRDDISASGSWRAGGVGSGNNCWL